MSSEYFVYVMAKKDGESISAPVKIGMAKNPKTRVQEIGTSCPFRLEVAVHLSMPSKTMARALERAFHATQADRRLHGEWFDIEPEEAIRLLCFGYRVLLEKLCPGDERMPKILERSGINAAEKIVGRYEIDDEVTLQ